MRSSRRFNRFWLLALALVLPLTSGALPAGADDVQDEIDKYSAYANEQKNKVVDYADADPYVEYAEEQDEALLEGLFPAEHEEERVAQVSAGNGHTCVVTEAGNAYCWGSNGSGQLGDSTTTSSSTPVQVATGAGLTPGTITHISAGGGHTCALTNSGNAYCWGSNWYGRLGDGTTTSSSTPVQVHAGAGLTPGTITHITAGTFHTCALTDTGNAYCWGHNGSRELGDGTTTNRSTPVQVHAGAGLTPGTITHITAGSQYSCALTDTGNAYCWGRNDYKQLGDGTTISSSTPVQVAEGEGLTPGTVTHITAGTHIHTCALTNSGNAYCWGSNGDGQLGDGTTTSSSTPVQVHAGAGLIPGTIAHISAGGDHTCAVAGSGNAYCWGWNEDGQLGDGTTTDRSTPVHVHTGEGLTPGTITHITAGEDRTCALTNSSNAYCWGEDRASTTPVRIAVLRSTLGDYCRDDGTRVDRVDWDNGANHFSVDVHQTDDEVITCIRAERNGEVVFARDVHVPSNEPPVPGEPPTLDLPPDPNEPPDVVVDEDAPPGNTPDSPCREVHGEGGSTNARAYARSSTTDSDPVVVCAGIKAGGAERHVRVTIG